MGSHMKAGGSHHPTSPVSSAPLRPLQGPEDSAPHVEHEEYHKQPEDRLQAKHDKYQRQQHEKQEPLGSRTSKESRSEDGAGKWNRNLCEKAYVLEGT